LFDEDALKVVTGYFKFKDEWVEKGATNLGYDENLTLANDLFESCPPDKYRGSPFALPPAEKVILN
jgi:hypothetical protein